MDEHVPVEMLEPVMTRREYIRIVLDSGNLQELNSLSGYGWRVIATFSEDRFTGGYTNYALLEREIRVKAKR